jgi:hypothetical protein
LTAEKKKKDQEAAAQTPSQVSVGADGEEV